MPSLLSQISVSASAVCIAVWLLSCEVQASNLYCNEHFTCSREYTMGMNPKTNPFETQQLSNTFIHPMCWLDNCKPQAHCGNTYLLCNTVKFRNIMVKLHNSYKHVAAERGHRHKVRQNYNTSNFQTLSYDLEMEFIAACMSVICVEIEEKDGENGCRFDPVANYYNMDIRNSLPMRISSKQGDFGYKLFTTPDAFDEEEFLRMFLEVGWFIYEGTRSNNYNFNLFGCARRVSQIQYEYGRAHSAIMILVCVFRVEYNYSVVHDEHFCSMCNYPNEICSRANNRLCGEPRPYEENVFAPPFKMYDHDVYLQNGPGCTYSPLYDIPPYTKSVSTRRTPLTFAPVTTNTPDSGTTDTPAPVTPAPVTPATDTPAPVTPATDTPAPVTPATDTPAPVTPATDTPAPVTPATDTPAPVTPATDTPAPVTPATDTPAPTNQPNERVIRDEPNDSSSTDSSSDDSSSDTPSPTNAPPTNAPPTNAPSTNSPPTDSSSDTASPTNAPPTNAPPTNSPPTDASSDDSSSDTASPSDASSDDGPSNNPSTRDVSPDTLPDGASSGVPVTKSVITDDVPVKTTPEGTTTEELDDEDIAFLDKQYAIMLEKLQLLVPLVEKLFYMAYYRKQELQKLWRLIEENSFRYDPFKETREDFTFSMGYNGAESLWPLDKLLLIFVCVLLFSLFMFNKV